MAAIYRAATSGVNCSPSVPRSPLTLIIGSLIGAFGKETLSYWSLIKLENRAAWDLVAGLATIQAARTQEAAEFM